MTQEKNVETIRQLLQHENELTNHRVTWLNTVQGLLFAALAVLITAEKNNMPSSIPLVAFVGIAVAVLSFIGTTMSSYAVCNLLKWWEDNKGDYKGPPVVGAVDKYSPLLVFFMPSNLLAIVFSVAWVVVLCRS